MGGRYPQIEISHLAELVKLFFIIMISLTTYVIWGVISGNI